MLLICSFSLCLLSVVSPRPTADIVPLVAPFEAQDVKRPADAITRPVESPTRTYIRAPNRNLQGSLVGLTAFLAAVHGQEDSVKRNELAGFTDWLTKLRDDLRNKFLQPLIGGGSGASLSGPGASLSDSGASDRGSSGPEPPKIDEPIVKEEGEDQTQQNRSAAAPPPLTAQVRGSHPQQFLSTDSDHLLIGLIPTVPSRGYEADVDFRDKAVAGEERRGPPPPSEARNERMVNERLDAAFGLGPSEGFGLEPSEAFGLEPSEAFGLEPSEAFGLEPLDAFGLAGGAPQRSNYEQRRQGLRFGGRRDPLRGEYSSVYGGPPANLLPPFEALPLPDSFRSSTADQLVNPFRPGAALTGGWTTARRESAGGFY